MFILHCRKTDFASFAHIFINVLFCMKQLILTDVVIAQIWLIDGNRFCFWDLTVCLFWTQSRSEWHGSLPWQTHLWPAESPQSLRDSLAEYGEGKSVTLSSSGSPAGTEGPHGPQIPSDRHVKEDAHLGCRCHHPRRRLVNYSRCHTAYSCRP